VDGEHELLVVALPLPWLAGADALLPAAGWRLWRRVLWIVRLFALLLPGQHPLLHLPSDPHRAVVLLLDRPAIRSVADGQAAVAFERVGGAEHPGVGVASGVSAARTGARAAGGLR